MARNRLKDLRRRVYHILEQGPVGDRVSKSVDRFLVVLILINLIAVALESIPEYEARYGAAFAAIEFFSLVVFTIEYSLRVWCAVEHGPHQHLSATQARLKYVLSPAGIIDLIAVLPFWFAMVLPGDLRVVLVFRMVRFFKIRALFAGNALVAGRPLQREARVVWLSCHRARHRARRGLPDASRRSKRAARRSSAQFPKPSGGRS